MQLDLRIPIGLMFSLLGGVLTAYGALSDPALYQRSLGVNVNWWWGLALVTFGVVMLVFGLRGSKRPR